MSEYDDNAALLDIFHPSRSLLIQRNGIMGKIDKSQ